MPREGLIKSGLSLIKTAFKSLSYSEEPKFNLNPATYPNDDYGHNAWHFWGNNWGMDICVEYNTYAQEARAFRDCPPLSTIIKKKAFADLNGRRLIKNSVGKEATSATANAIRAKMAQPNVLQNWRGFRAQQKIYIQTHGFCILFATYPTGYEKSGLVEATNIWNISPALLDIKLTGKTYWQTDVKEIIEYIKLGDTYLPLDNIYIFEDNGAVSFKNNVFPESRIRDQKMPINNIIAALDSRNTLIRRRGALGILSPKARDGTGAITVPLKPQEKEQLQRDWRQYGTSSDQYNVVISNAAIDWTRITMDVSELKLFEEVQDNSMSLCDAWGYPPHLMGLLDPTFSNQLAAQKGLYQDTIIPEAESDDDTWNEAFRTSENNLKIVTNFDHLPILQADAKDKAAARNTLDQALEREFYNNLITLNRWLELLGEDTRTDGNMYYSDLVAQGKQFGKSTVSVGVNGQLQTSANGA